MTVTSIRYHRYTGDGRKSTIAVVSVQVVVLTGGVGNKEVHPTVTVIIAPSCTYRVEGI